MSSDRDGREVSFYGNESDLQLVVMVAKFWEILKTTALYILKRQILRYVNHISVKL